MPCKKKAEKNKLLLNFALNAVDKCIADINQTYDLCAGMIR